MPQLNASEVAPHSYEVLVDRGVCRLLLVVGLSSFLVSCFSLSLSLLLFLSRAYLQADDSQHGNILEYQIFQLSQEQFLFQDIADINQADFMSLSEGT